MFFAKHPTLDTDLQTLILDMQTAPDFHTARTATMAALSLFSAAYDEAFHAPAVPVVNYERSTRDHLIYALNRHCEWFSRRLSAAIHKKNVELLPGSAGLDALQLESVDTAPE